MPDDLGARLLRAGLVTRDQLAATLASAPQHGGALVGALVARGVPEDALAGFFLADGFGPLMEADDLAGADPAARRRLPAEMAADLMALPVRASPAGLVVAMAAPSDRHAVREIARVVGGDVLPTVACVGALRAALRNAYPAHAAHIATPPPAGDREEESDPPPPVESDPPPPAVESEPPVLELVRRRSPPAEPRSSAASSSPWMGSTEGSSREEAREEARDDARLALGPRLIADDDEPALPLVRTKPQLTPPRGVERPEPEAPPAAKVISKAFARPEGVRRVQLPPFARESRRGTAEYPAIKDGSGEIAAAIRAAAAAAAKAAAEPAEPEPQPEPPPRAISSAPAGRPTSIVPPEHERWDLGSPSPSPSSSGPPAPARPARLGVRARSELPPAKASLPEVGTVLAGIRSAPDRDVVVRLACEGAVTVARTTVFLALRKGVLKGWEGAGGGLSRDALRNLWIPTTSPSTFKHVVDRQEAYVGAYGSSVADGLFRAAVGSRGGDLVLQPIVVGEKVVGVLCADDLLPMPVARQRIELLAHAVSEAFKRIIYEKKG